MILVFGCILGLICGMRSTKMNIAGQMINDEGKHHVSSIYVPDTSESMHGKVIESHNQNNETDHCRIPERNCPEMVEISNIDNSFPPPPPESFLQSINHN